MQSDRIVSNVPFLIALIVSSILQAEIIEPIIARNSAGDYNYRTFLTTVETIRSTPKLDQDSIQKLYSFGTGSLHYAGMLLQEHQSSHTLALFEQSYKEEKDPWAILSFRELLWHHYTQEDWAAILQRLPQKNALLEYRDFYFLRMSALYRLERYTALQKERRDPPLLLLWNRVSESMLEHEELIWECIMQFSENNPLWIETLATLLFDVDDPQIDRRLHIYMQNQDPSIRNSPATALLLDVLAAKFAVTQQEYAQAHGQLMPLIPQFAEFNETILDILYFTAVQSEALAETSRALALQTHTHQDEPYLLITIARLFREQELYARAEGYYQRALNNLADGPQQMTVYAEWVWVSFQNNPRILTDVLEKHEDIWRPYAPYFDKTLEAILAELLQKKSWITIGAVYRLLATWKSSRAAMHFALAYVLSPIAKSSEKDKIFTLLYNQHASPFAASIASLALGRIAPVFNLDRNTPDRDSHADLSARIIYDYAKLGLAATMQAMLEDHHVHPHIAEQALTLHNAGLAYWSFKALNRSDHGKSYVTTLPFYPVLYTDGINYENMWLVLALIREESRFHTTIRSAAGAVGLMQLIPATAAELSKKHAITFDSLENPTHNIQLGTTYMKDLSRRFDTPAEIIAAYNAGPNRVRRWKNALPRNPILFSLAIPFRETRNHVRKVFESLLWYTTLYDADTLAYAPQYFFSINKSAITN